MFHLCVNTPYRLLFAVNLNAVSSKTVSRLCRLERHVVCGDPIKSLNSTIACTNNLVNGAYRSQQPLCLQLVNHHRVGVNARHIRPFSALASSHSSHWHQFGSSKARSGSFSGHGTLWSAKFSQDTGKEGVEETEEEFGQFVREVCSIPGLGHHVLVIQPDIKAGSRRYVLTTKELKLEETCALVRTLPRWKVVDKKIVRTDHENTKQVFGKGNFEMLVGLVRGMRSISAVVIGLDRLTGLQVDTLQKAWGVPVYDRYTIVLQIFKDHAKSPEARLQVALAEIPYLKARMQLLHGGFDLGVSQLVGGTGARFMDRRRELVQKLESRLKKDLETLHNKRQGVREKRQSESVPTVAVVGYTNAGKTTLIKAMTEDPSLVPEDHLFATLDVTAHEGRLGPRMKTVFIDTVGFISDMPRSLLEAFRATLEDAVMADVVLHVRDASHPDRKLQTISVHRTLENMLSSKQMADVIEVYNKVDLLSEE